MKHADQTVALLVDGDNASAEQFEDVLHECARYGRIIIKRVYGNWCNTKMQRWQEIGNQFALKPVANFDYVKGKNATDINLVIDAMDLLHSKEVDAFCIYSDDSDFTILAKRLKESGKQVIGIGSDRASISFQNACDVFTKSSVLEEQNQQVQCVEHFPPQALGAPQNEPHIPVTKWTAPKELVTKIRKSYRKVEADCEQVGLHALGMMLRTHNPSFDHRNYGFSTLSKLLQELDAEFRLYKIDSKPSTLFVKDKRL